MVEKLMRKYLLKTTCCGLILHDVILYLLHH